MPIPLHVPTFFLDGGPHFDHAQGYWQQLLAAQRASVLASFGSLEPVPGVGTDDISAIRDLEAPSVLVVPALSGGRVRKDWGAWWAFRGALRDYRAAGGIVVLLEAAAHLPAEGRRAKGRGLFDMDRDARPTKVQGQATFLLGGDPAPVASIDAHGLNLYADWRYVGNGSGVPPEAVAFIEAGGTRLPVAWKWQAEEWEQPGAMIFTSTWGWVGRDQANEKSWTRNPFNAAVIADVQAAYAALNRALVGRTLTETLRRTAARLRRLVRLTGESERLPHRTGKEKDYHRLLLNDRDLLVDLIGWRSLVEERDHATREFRTAFAGAEVVNEPGHDKGNGGAGRLDILLRSVWSGEAPESRDASYLGQAGRSPCAWIELEAGSIHEAQMNAFVNGHGAQLGPRDWVVAVDRSPDDDPAVKRVAERVAATGARFLHVRVPSAFARLEEHYAPEMHRVSRKRYTLEVIRGLLG